MSLKVQKDKVRLSAITHEVRASQAVLQYGVGAMVDFPEQTLMTAAPEYWEDSTDVIHDERLEKLLHVTHFATPKNYGDAKGADGVSYVRFPEWYFCPKCRHFKPMSSWVADFKKKGRPKEVESDPYMAKHPRCIDCRQDLVVARIVTACECGHIDDFPWIKWVHCQNLGGPRSVCSHPELTFKTSATSSEGLEGLAVACKCGARATLKGAFDKDRLKILDEKTGGEYDFRCTGRHPWKNEKEQCSLYPSVKQRGSSSVYFSCTESSLVIPPYSSRLTEKIENSRKFQECKNAIAPNIRIPGLPAEVKAAIIETNILNFAQSIALEISASKDKVIEVLRRKWQSGENEEYSTAGVRYRAEEYEALRGDIALSGDHDDGFVRESTNISEYGLPFLRGISLIHKIREVEALTGFSRLNPARYGGEEESSDHFVNIKQPETDWYPACQIYGEGIFIEFDAEAINRWRSGNDEIIKRVNILNENYAKSFIGRSRPRTITSKFLFLHTLSHLLIKQLSFECGYGIASLKERLYCSEEAEGKEMAGILIYTAVGDSEGTLGGLVRQGRSDTFPQLFRKAILSAVTCSNDPVCSLSNGQGRDSLNLSACYSCCLLPETCCEEFNIFLDRGTVVGIYDHRDIGFFSESVWGEAGKREKPSPKTSVKTVGQNSIRSRNNVLIVENGTDVRASSYREIWENLLQWSGDASEKKLLSELADKCDQFSGKEKPLQDAYFKVTGLNMGASYGCSLLWKNSKVAFFTEEQKEDYETASSTDWTCYYSCDPQMRAEKIIESIMEVG